MSRGTLPAHLLMMLDYFNVRNGKLEGRDPMEAVFTTDAIDIS